VQERRVPAHSIEDIHHRRQELVLDVDQVNGLLSGMRITGRDGSDGVPDIGHLVASQRIVVQIPEADTALSRLRRRYTTADRSFAVTTAYTPG
jgi:hypothetical protein